MLCDRHVTNVVSFHTKVIRRSVNVNIFKETPLFSGVRDTLGTNNTWRCASHTKWETRFLGEEKPFLQEQSIVGYVP